MRDWNESVWMNGEMAILMNDGLLKHGTIDRMMDIQTSNIPFEVFTLNVIFNIYPPLL